jgi:hypothetical protein
MGAASRVHPPRPDLAGLIRTHRKVRAALTDAQAGRDVEAVLAALTSDRTDDAQGLAELLTELRVTRPSELLDTIRMLVLSASYTSLTWSGGLAAAGGTRYTERDVLSTSWAAVEWLDSDDPDAPRG